MRPNGQRNLIRYYPILGLGADWSRAAKFTKVCFDSALHPLNRLLSSCVAGRREHQWTVQEEEARRLDGVSTHAPANGNALDSVPWLSAPNGYF